MSTSDDKGGVAGRRILVVEDDYMVAEDLRIDLEELGALVLGPVAKVAAALELIAGGDRIDGATLDVTLGREKSFPVADALKARAIPFVFMTGYDSWAIPEAYRAFPRCSKPADIDEVVAHLLA
jgi:CheY-like chemotaxis protein